MSLEKAKWLISNKFGATTKEYKEKGIKTLEEYKETTSKKVDEIYDEWEKQKDAASNIIKLQPEKNTNLLEQRTKIHTDAVNSSKRILKDEIKRTLAGNTYLGEDFNRNAMNFITGLAKNEKEIEEIGKAIKNKDKAKLTKFFKSGIERLTKVLNNSMNDRDDSERLKDITDNYYEYKALAEMQEDQINNIVKSLGIEKQVKKEVNNWITNYSKIAVSASMQRNYINLFSSPLYPDMGIDKMFKNIPNIITLSENTVYQEELEEKSDNILQSINAEMVSFKSQIRSNKDAIIALANEECLNTYDFLKIKGKKENPNIILDNKGMEISKENFANYMLSGKKVYVYDNEGNYLSSMIPDKNHMGAFKYNSKNIDYKKNEDFVKGITELRDLLNKSNPKVLVDPKREYTQILNEVNDLSTMELSTEERNEKIKKIVDLSAKYMSSHKKPTGITGIGEKRRNAIEMVYNSCKKINDKINLEKELEIKRNLDRKTLEVNEANVFTDRKEEIVNEIAKNATLEQRRMAEMLRNNAKRTESKEENTMVK